MTQKSMDEWLTLAYRDSADCPPPETFLEGEWNALSQEQRDAAATHAEHCSACAAERDLAFEFDQPNVGADDTQVGLNEVLARIDDSTPGLAAGEPQAEGVRLLRFPLMAKVVSQPVLGLAAAAVAVLAAGIVLQTRSAAPPALPDAPISAVTRGGAIENVAPAGVISSPPETLAWDAVEEAALYRVRLTTVDNELLLSAETTQTTAVVPADLRSELRPAVVYFWQVEAFSDSGSRIAWSAPVEIRVAPNALEETK